MTVSVQVFEDVADARERTKRQVVMTALRRGMAQARRTEKRSSLLSAHSHACALCAASGLSDRAVIKTVSKPGAWVRRHGC